MLIVALVESITSGDIAVRPGRSPTGIPLSEGTTLTVPSEAKKLVPAPCRAVKPG